MLFPHQNMEDGYIYFSFEGTAFFLKWKTLMCFRVSRKKRLSSPLMSQAEEHKKSNQW